MRVKRAGSRGVTDIKKGEGFNIQEYIEHRGLNTDFFLKKKRPKLAFLGQRKIIFLKTNKQANKMSKQTYNSQTHKKKSMWLLS